MMLLFLYPKNMYHNTINKVAIYNSEKWLYSFFKKISHYLFNIPACAH